MTDDWPKLTVLLLTWTDDANGPRAKYAKATLRACLDNLRYSGQISVHIADDGSPQKHRDALVKLAGGYDSVIGVSESNSQGRGYGANFNLATQTVHIHASLVLPLEDDWTLSQEFNIDPYVQAMQESPRIRCIRLGYLGYTQSLKGELVYAANNHFLAFDEASPERHVCAGHPRLEWVSWEREVGPWPEGVDPGSTEFGWCGVAAARRGVAWPLNAPPAGWFYHTGTIQARVDQREAVS